MPDRESVITHLQIIHTWASFARERDVQFFTPKHLEDIAEWADDALELIHDQQSQIAMLVVAQHELCEMMKEQPEVVRCKDCINCVKEPNGELYCDILAVGYEPLGSKKVNADWFCADGERQEVK